MNTQPFGQTDHERGQLQSLYNMLAVWWDYVNHRNCKSFPISSSSHAKSSRSKMFSCLVTNVSHVLLIISWWFLILLLCELYEQLISLFFLWRIISTKKLSAVGKPQLRNLAGMSSRTYKATISSKFGHCYYLSNFFWCAMQ